MVLRLTFLFILIANFSYGQFGRKFNAGIQAGFAGGPPPLGRTTRAVQNNYPGGFILSLTPMYKVSRNFWIDAHADLVVGLNRSMTSLGFGSQCYLFRSENHGSAFVSFGVGWYSGQSAMLDDKTAKYSQDLFGVAPGIGFIYNELFVKFEYHVVPLGYRTTIDGNGKEIYSDQSFDYIALKVGILLERPQ